MELKLLVNNEKLNLHFSFGAFRLFIIAMEKKKLSLNKFNKTCIKALLSW